MNFSRLCMILLFLALHGCNGKLVNDVRTSSSKQGGETSYLGVASPAGFDVPQYRYVQVKSDLSIILYAKIVKFSEVSGTSSAIDDFFGSNAPTVPDQCYYTLQLDNGIEFEWPHTDCEYKSLVNREVIVTVSADFNYRMQDFSAWTASGNKISDIKMSASGWDGLGKQT